jgi:hypothetical protein
LKLSHIIKAIYDPEIRLFWEKKCLNNLKLRETDHKNAYLIYYFYKAAIVGMNEKDFSDKVLLFEHEGAVYVYQSTNSRALEDAQSDEKENEESSSVDRCITYMTIQKYWYN